MWVRNQELWRGVLESWTESGCCSSRCCWPRVRLDRFNRRRLTLQGADRRCTRPAWMGRRPRVRRHRLHRQPPAPSHCRMATIRLASGGPTRRARSAMAMGGSGSSCTRKASSARPTTDAPGPTAPSRSSSRGREASEATSESPVADWTRTPRLSGHRFPAATVAPAFNPRPSFFLPRGAGR
jgi:hypothetical protein